MDWTKIIYWATTGLMCLLFTMSATMYFVKYDDVAATFGILGFPTWVVIPLAIAKILGVIAVLTKASKLLKEWAYAGFFFDSLLAFGAHYYANDGGTIAAVIALVLIVVSRIYDGKMYA